MCSVLDVSPSGYYASVGRPASQRSVDDAELSEHIVELFEHHKRRYGARRIARELRKRGYWCSTKRVARLMRTHGLSAQRRRKRVKTTDSSHRLPVAANVVAQDFSATAPNQKWAGDITYVQTDEGWLYLAVFVDLFSRRVIGWAMSDRIDGALTRAALMMALLGRKPMAGLIIHSDRGSQYAAGAYQQMLRDWSATPSMSRKGNCYDNAVSESFFATLKGELVEQQQYRSRDDARRSIFEYIECYYNRQRMHSTLGYLCPVDYEQQWHQHQVPTAEEPTSCEHLAAGTRRCSILGGVEDRTAISLHGPASARIAKTERIEIDPDDFSQNLCPL
jgi:transposase InsO family protein